MDSVCPSHRWRSHAARGAPPIALCCALLLPAAWGRAQRIDVEPSVGDVGRDAAVTVSDHAGAPLAGVAVQARSAAGEAIELGVTDSRGAVVFRPQAAGSYELETRLSGELRLIAPYVVQPQRRRWLWALVWVPAGLLLLWVNARAARRRGR